VGHLVQPLLISQVRNDVATSPRAIKRNFRALGQLLKESGAQVVFSILPVAGNDKGRNKKSQQNNTCL